MYILSMLIPGAGLIYLGKEHINKGVRVSVFFVIASFLSFNIANQFLFEFLRSGFGRSLADLIVPPIIFIPVFLIWYKHLRTVLKITKEIEMKPHKN